MIAGRRHSVVDYLVFGLALLLLAVLAYQGVERGLPALLGRAARVAAEPAAAQPPERHELSASGTAGAPTSVAAVRVSPARKAKKKTAFVPPPAGL